ncbi:MAG: hypothetical protein ACKVP4_09040 [Hyphomicrobium sp.]
MIIMARALSVACALAAFNAQASADDTGFAASHDLRKERGRLCMSEHAHSATGEGNSKDSARSAAIKEWYAYTAGEYGSDWGSWGKSASQKISYAKAESGWSATIESRPCK